MLVCITCRQNTPAPLMASEEIVLDFAAGTYTVNGDAVSFGSLIDGNSFFGSAGDFSGTVTGGVGMVSPSEGAFIGAALDQILLGATLIWEITFTNVATPGVECWLFDDPGFNDSLFIDVSNSSSLVGDFDSDFPDGTLVEGANKVGGTFSADNVALSVNGSAAVGKTTPTIGTPNTMGFTLVGAGGATTATKLTIIPAVDNAELATLTA